jgi:flagellar biosynthesis protein
VVDKKDRKTINPDKISEAAALHYDPDESGSPKLVALGKGEVAEKIIAKAKEHNIPVVQDKNLAHTLNQLNIGDEIPPELYEVVAEILAFVSSLDRSYREKIELNLKTDRSSREKYGQRK